MTRSFAFRVAVTGFAFAVGFGLAYGVFEASRSTSSFLFVACLFVVAAGALWLGRRQVVELEEDEFAKPQGPHLIFERDSRGRKRSPEFYEDLRQRETTLESLEGRGPERRTQKIIELPVGDQCSMKSDR